MGAKLHSGQNAWPHDPRSAAKTLPGDTRGFKWVRQQVRWLLLFGCFGAPACADPPRFDQSLESVLSADGSLANPGRFSDDWQVLSQANREQILDLLASLDRAGPVAANWIRPAIDAALAALAQQDERLSAAELEQFIRDTQHGWRSRQLALRELARSYPSASAQLEADLIHDPVADFRQPAITQLLARAAEKDIGPDAKKSLLFRAWDASREEGQCLAIAKQLKELGEVVDPLQHFGWLTRWYVAGPFADEKDEAYDTGFAPEQDVAAAMQAATFLGEQWRTIFYRQGTKEIAWQPHIITKDNGELDFNELLGRMKGVAAYAAALIESDQDRDVEIRLRQQNAFKLWLNGAVVAAQPVGHTGNSFDQYTFPVRLKQGTNLLLIKSAQIHPPMAHPFFETWHASARICDGTGGAIEGVAQPDIPAPPS